MEIKEYVKREWPGLEDRTNKRIVPVPIQQQTEIRGGKRVVVRTKQGVNSNGSKM
ncbi:hypothetical protein [uncultured Imperialibacter sp.]|uniref:hypothetical protein n=1 Tax=uncultured Imperialibacter sp. TaxID=1672639 RepID=UPI0030D70795|tara:strand:- start:16295 stop:16459 length:165 start_codon:yes stop_codon:yes gene_type:complete